MRLLPYEPRPPTRRRRCSVVAWCARPTRSSSSATICSSS